MERISSREKIICIHIEYGEKIRCECNNSDTSDAVFADDTDWARDKSQSKISTRFDR